MKSFPENRKAFSILISAWEYIEGNAEGHINFEVLIWIFCISCEASAVKNEELLKKLNWFYSLEKSQVDMYLRQSARTEDEHLANALHKFAQIEQGHVESISKLIEELGETPTIIGEVIGEITGTTAGRLSSLVTMDKVLKLNIALESKAISDYHELINGVDDDYIQKQLYNNMLDEELHKAWMKERLEKKVD